MLSQPLDRQLPHGVTDLFFNDAARKRAVERGLADSFARWGYSEIIPPMFEYYESLAAEAGTQLREEMYRFFDRDGRTLALRADFTIPTARVVGTRLYDRAMPLRFYYVGSVFRYEEPQAGVRREFTQAGIELAGAPTADADAEVVALAMASLQAIGLSEFRFTLSTSAYLQATTRGLVLSESDDIALRDALRRKNGPALSRLLDSLTIDPRQKRALAQLPGLWGGGAILDQVETVNAEARAAVEHLRVVLQRLEQFGFREHVTVDLAENRGMEYYTGIIFEGFVQGVGFPVVSGGRYDNLVSHFGPSIPAVGFAIGVERALMALSVQAGSARERATIAPDVVACEYSSRVRQARERGQIVEVDVLGRDADALREYARVRGAREIWLRGGRTEALR